MQVWRQKFAGALFNNQIGREIVIKSLAEGLPIEFRRERAEEYLQALLSDCTREIDGCPLISREIRNQVRDVLSDDLINNQLVTAKPFVQAMTDWNRKVLCMLMTELRRLVWERGLGEARKHYGSDAVEAAIKNMKCALGAL